MIICLFIYFKNSMFQDTLSKVEQQKKLGMEGINCQAEETHDSWKTLLKWVLRHEMFFQCLKQMINFPFVNVSLLTFFLVLQDVSELRNELQRKELLVQKHLSKLHHWQQVLEDVSGQHRKPSDLPPPGPLAFLEQASASLPPAPLKPN